MAGCGRAVRLIAERRGHRWSAAPYRIRQVKVRLLRSRDRAHLSYPQSHRYRWHKQRAAQSAFAFGVSDDDMLTWKVKMDLVVDPNASLNYPDGFIDEERREIHFAWERRKRVYIMAFLWDIW